MPKRAGEEIYLISCFSLLSSLPIPVKMFFIMKKANSFLVRIIKTPKGKELAGEVHHIQSQERMFFHSEEELVEFIKKYTQCFKSQIPNNKV